MGVILAYNGDPPEHCVWIDGVLVGGAADLDGRLKVPANQMLSNSCGGNVTMM